MTRPAHLRVRDEGKKGRPFSRNSNCMWRDRGDGSLRRLVLGEPTATLSREGLEVSKALDGDPETGWGLSRTYGHHECRLPFGRTAARWPPPRTWSSP